MKISDFILLVALALGGWFVYQQSKTDQQKADEGDAFGDLLNRIEELEDKVETQTAPATTPAT